MVVGLSVRSILLPSYSLSQNAIQVHAPWLEKKVRHNNSSHIQTWCDVPSTAFPAYAAYSATKFAVRAMTQSAGKIELPLTQAAFLIVALICKQPLSLESTESPSTLTARETLTHPWVRHHPTCIRESLFLTFGNQVHNMIPMIAEKTGADPEAIKKQVSICDNPPSGWYCVFSTNICL